MFTPAPAHGRRAHYLFAAALFAILGFHVGVWAVQLAPLSAGLRLDPAALGAAVTVAASAGLVTLFAGGALADRAGRRPVLVIGFAGTGTAFVLMALAGAEHGKAQRRGLASAPAAGQAPPARVRRRGSPERAAGRRACAPYPARGRAGR